MDDEHHGFLFTLFCAIFGLFVFFAYCLIELPQVAYRNLREKLLP